MTRDPVCQSEVDEHEAIGRGMFWFHNEQTYYFCGPECQMRFREHPEEYSESAPQWDSTLTSDEYLG